MSGKLDPKAETRSRANALYADAMANDPDSHPQEALDLLRQVIALDPHFVDAQLKAATLQLQSNSVDLALTQLKAAAQANPDSVAIAAMLGYAQHLRGQNDEALRTARRALAQDPTQATAMRVLLEVASDQSDLAGGVLHVEDILKNSSTKIPASAWLSLARLYEEAARGDAHPPSGEMLLKTLLPIYQQAAAVPPPDIATLTLLADTYRDLGRKRDSLDALLQAHALKPADVDILLRCADLETDLGAKPEALQFYEKAYALNPGLAGLTDTLGRLYLESARFDDAARLGSPPETYLKVALTQLAAQHFKEAGATLAAAQASYPASARICFCRAIQLRYEKNYPAALACLDQVRALAIGPEADVLDPGYYLETVVTLDLAGQKNRIEALLHEGLAKFPNNADLMNELAYFWADQGTHLPEALALSARAAELEPDNGAIQDTRGWVFFQLGQAKDALPYLQRAALLTNNDPVVLQHVGDTYLKLGLKDDAVAAWRRGLEKDPANRDLTNRIDAALAQAKNAHTRSALTP